MRQNARKLYRKEIKSDAQQQNLWMTLEEVKKTVFTRDLLGMLEK